MIKQETVDKFVEHLKSQYPELIIKDVKQISRISIYVSSDFTYSGEELLSSIDYDMENSFIIHPMSENYPKVSEIAQELINFNEVLREEYKDEN